MRPKFPSRRRFLQTATVGAIVGPTVTLSRAAAPASATSQAWPDFARGELVRTRGELKGDGRLIEAERAIPIAGRSQVLVVGAGPAGIGAAIAAISGVVYGVFQLADLIT